MSLNKSKQVDRSADTFHVWIIVNETGDDYDIIIMKYSQGFGKAVQIHTRAYFENIVCQVIPSRQYICLPEELG